MSVVGQWDPCVTVIVLNSLEYAREGDNLFAGGAPRLAVMAVDFSRWSRRSFAGWRHRELRAKHPLHGMCNAEDRPSIAEALLRLGRPGSGPKRPRAGWG